MKNTMIITRKLFVDMTTELIICIDSNSTVLRLSETLDPKGYEGKKMWKYKGGQQCYQR